MDEDVKLLKKEFQRIKNLGLIKTFRKGPTGVGYTFEKLINKEEDQESKPDFGCIELKCKLGYSKSAITLFNCVPYRNGESAIKYIFNNYSNYRYGNKEDIKIFARKIFSNYSTISYNYKFKLKIDYYHTEIILKAYYKDDYLEDVCSWDFKLLEKKLKTKLTNLALIEAYPYYIDNQIYYKYVKLQLYKLKGFYEFLKLIEDDKIFVNFYIKSALDKNGNEILLDHGVGFRIENRYIEDLFYKLKH